MKTNLKIQFSKMLFVAFMLFASSQLFAQTTYSVKGRVLNSQKQPINFATALLQKANTLEIVAGGVCNAKGVFVFENIEPGEYIILVNHIGFKKPQTRRIILTETDVKIDKSSFVLE